MYELLGIWIFVTSIYGLYLLIDLIIKFCNEVVAFCKRQRYNLENACNDASMLIKEICSRDVLIVGRNYNSYIITGTEIANIEGLLKYIVKITHLRFNKVVNDILIDDIEKLLSTTIKDKMHKYKPKFPSKRCAQMLIEIYKVHINYNKSNIKKVTMIYFPVPLCNIVNDYMYEEYVIEYGEFGLEYNIFSTSTNF